MLACFGVASLVGDFWGVSLVGSGMGVDGGLALVGGVSGFFGLGVGSIPLIFSTLFYFSFSSHLLIF